MCTWKYDFSAPPTTSQQSPAAHLHGVWRITSFGYFEPSSFIRHLPGPFWKETNSLLTSSMSLITSQTSNTLFCSSPPIFLFQTDKYSLFNCAAQTPFCIQMMPFIHLWIASIATATLLDIGRMIAVQRYRQRVDLCGHITLPSVFYSFSNNSQPLSQLFDSCQAPIWYVHRIPYFNTKASLLNYNSQFRAQISYEN